MVSQRDGRERHLWFDATPVQLIHERWTTVFSVFWAAQLPRLQHAAAGAPLDAVCAGAKAPLRPLHGAVMKVVQGFGDFKAAPKKGHGSLRRRKQNAPADIGSVGEIDALLKGRLKRAHDAAG